MHEWEYSASGPMRMAGDADCVCAVCGAVEGREHEPSCPIGLARADWNCLENENTELRARADRAEAENARLLKAIASIKLELCSLDCDCSCCDLNRRILDALRGEEVQRG